MKKRKIIIYIDDYCELPFELVDKAYWDEELSKLLMDYDIEITKIEVEDDEN